MNCEEYRELVAADIDAVLSSEEGRVATSHVASCAKCAALRATQLALSNTLRRHRPEKMPDDLRQRVLANLAAEGAIRAPEPSDTEQTTRAKVYRLQIRKRIAMVGAIAAAVLLMLFPLGQPSHPDLLSILVADVRAAEAGEIQMSMETQDISELASYYARQSELGFERTIQDLSGMGFDALGGTVRPIGDVAATFTIYDGQAGRIVCRRFPAGAIDIPEGGEEIDGAIVFTRDGISMRFQRDGDATCCLASAMPRQVFLLQFAKGGTIHSH